MVLGRFANGSDLCQLKSHRTKPPTQAREAPSNLVIAAVRYSDDLVEQDVLSGSVSRCCSCADSKVEFQSKLQITGFVGRTNDAKIAGPEAVSRSSKVCVVGGVEDFETKL